MNKLTIPPGPNWTNNNIVTCSYDGILIYGSRNNHIVLIYPAKNPNEAVDMKFIYNVTNSKERLIGVAIDHDNWSKEKLIASAGTDNVVKIWDAESLTLKQVNNAHKDASGKCVAVNYVNNSVISVTDDGQIAVWNVLTNTVRLLRNNLFSKVKITCMATSRHSPFLSCFATMYGDVYLIQTKGKGKILHRVKCVDSEITALSFCPIPYHSPKNPEKNDYSKEMDKLAKNLKDCAIVNDERPKYTKENVWSNLKFPDDDEFIMDDRENADNDGSSEDEPISKPIDFLEECSRLQKDIRKVFNTSNIFEEDDGSPVSKKSFGKKNSNHLLSLLNQSSELDHTSYDFLDTSTDCSESIVKDTEVQSASSELNNAENLLLLKTMKDNADVSLASSLIVEIDESVDNDTIDNVSEFSEERVIQMNTPDSTCDIEENPADVENVSSESAESLKVEINVLLVICCKYNSPSIWCFDENGRLRKKFQIPSLKKKNRPKRYETVCKASAYWAAPDLILYSTDNGCLCAWDYSTDDQQAKDNKSRLIHSDHKNKAIFAIATPYYMEEDNLLATSYVWTFGQDRSVICTSLSADRRCLHYYPTCNGFIYRISASPLDPNRIAIGCADYSIRLFDLSRPHTTIVNMVIANQNIKTKVMVTAWHPTKENCFAFGLHDGKVGVLDPSLPTKSVTYFHQFCHYPIYTLTWGPLKSQSDNQLFLYTCAEGVCVAYDIRHKEKEPIIVKFDKSESFKAVEVAWSSDYSILSIGSKDGSIVFLSADFSVLCMIYDFKKLIQCLSWHPQMTADDNDESKYVKYLAVGTFDNKLCVYNCGNVHLGERPVNIAKLEGHTDRINVVNWSPHTGGVLMSGSSDGTVRIWNVLSQTLLSTFYTGNSHVYTSIWSPFNSDLVLTGGRDFIIKIWKISEHPPVLDIVKPKSGTSSSAMIENTEQKNNQEYSNNSEDNNIDHTDSVAKMEATSSKSARKITYLPHLNRYQNSIGTLSNQLIDNLIRKFDNVTSAGTKDSEGEKTDNNSEICDPTNLFGSSNEVLNLLDFEQNDHFANKRYTAYQNIALWRGNVKPAIEEAIERKSLNPWLINLAPMVSIRFWRETCVAYAEQLKSANNHLEALSYYLAINDIENGINVLIDGHYYREALVIAKTRLSNDDPTIKNILKKWANYAVSIGSIEISAECYLALGDFESAAKILTRRCNVETLNIALKLANRAGNKHLADSIEITINEIIQKSSENSDKSVNSLPALPNMVDAIQLKEKQKTEVNLELCPLTESNVIENGQIDLSINF